MPRANDARGGEVTAAMPDTDWESLRAAAEELGWGSTHGREVIRRLQLPEQLWVDWQGSGQPPEPGLLSEVADDEFKRPIGGIWTSTLTDAGTRRSSRSSPEAAARW